MTEPLQRALGAILLAAILVLPFSTASAESYDGAQKNMDAKLEASLAELSKTRKKIAKEKIPMSRSVSKLEDQVLKLQRERDQLLALTDDSTMDLETLRDRVGRLEDQDEFVANRLTEFVRDFEGRLHISELAVYEELTATAKLAEKNVALDAVQKREAQIAVANAALERLQAQLGGQVFPGEALGPDGVLQSGQFIALGPTVFFVSSDGSVSGLVEQQINAADPVVVTLPSHLDVALAEVAASGRGQIPMDATLGKALKKEKARKSLSQYLADGGAVGYVIVALGLAALGLTAFKLMDVTRVSIADPGRVDAVLFELANGSPEGAFKLAKEVPGVAGQMLRVGVENANEKRAILEELLFERILHVRPVLERFLPFLAITAAAAPLLGLLGTVIGMIKTFQLITIFGTGDAKSLSSGISEALVTTALGLIVAIPVLILHGALSRMVRHKLGLLEQLMVAFVNGVTHLKKVALQGAQEQAAGASEVVHDLEPSTDRAGPSS